ncbi:MAG: heme o synthase [Phaeodactylibacter sp.]|nr:heme o synthase [Phaeodactylibacter sp.]
MLVKFRLTMTVVFSSVMAFLIALSGPVNWLAIFILAAGGFLVTGAANALNQVLEKDFDKLMKRTADRPLAAGRMSISEAVMAAGFMSLFGITLLALFNPWAAFFGTLALVTYAFLYTPMKRLSPSAVAVGAVPGALPTLIGCVAAQGELTFLGLSLFALQFLWQFPHFWSIGWLGFEDYANAGYKLMPTNQKGERDSRIGLQAFLYALFLVPVSIIPYMLGVSGWVSAVVVVILSLGYAYFGWSFYRVGSRKSALQLMFFSFAYIPVSLVALFADKF